MQLFTILTLCLSVISCAEEQQKPNIQDFVNSLNEYLDSEAQIYNEHVAQHGTSIPPGVREIREAFRIGSKAFLMSCSEDYPSDTAEWTPITVGKHFGSGGSKSAFAIKNSDKAILLSFIEPHCRYFSEELASRRLFEYLGIPCIDVEKCWLKTAESHDAMPVLVASSFQSYVAKGTYIIDTKNLGKHLPKKGLKNIVFGEDEVAAYSADVWMPILRPMIRDLKLASNNGIQVLGDKRNFALTRRGGIFHTRSDSEWEMRLFMFDAFEELRELRFGTPPVDWKGSVLKRAVKHAITLVLATWIIIPIDKPELKKKLEKDVISRILEEFGDDE